jgi:undecaprenyl-diphosphatase
MTPLFAFFLGVLQGLTEFLPVSSSGHLAAARLLHGMHEPELTFDIAVHVATLSAVLLYFRKPLTALVLGCAGRETPGEAPVSDQRHLLALIALTLIPTGLVFLGFGDFLENAGTRSGTLGGAFLVTAALLAATAWSGKRPPRVTSWGKMPWTFALAIGLAQGAALTPGISRSGATIAVALLIGLDRELAVRFSFFMAVPAIAGATLVPLVRGLEALPLSVLAAGVVGSFLVGLVSIHLLRWIVLARRLHWFAVYVCVMALVVFLAG